MRAITIAVLAATAVVQAGQAPAPADRPVPRSDANSATAHAQLLEKARRGRIDLYFAGDSITRRWGATDYPEFLADWTRRFFGWNAANFGWGADTTQNILWRLQNGELDGVHPKVIVLLAGTNNVGSAPSAVPVEDRAEDVSRGIKAILEVMRSKAPEATIVLTAIFPRNDAMAAMPVIDAINRRIAGFADGRSIRWLTVNGMLADDRGTLYDGMMADGLHPTLEGYRVWADALEPILLELLGARAADDRAPPPTGDPSKAATTVRSEAALARRR